MKCFAAEGIDPALTVEVLNDGSSGLLNHKVKGGQFLVMCDIKSGGRYALGDMSFPQCGADYVKTGQMAPDGMSYSEGEKCVSFDGDADRIVYFYKTSGLLTARLCCASCQLLCLSPEGNFRLLDGDKIAALVRCWGGK